MSAAPDLQALVEKYGGYDRIPPEAWIEHEKALARYIAAFRESARKKR